MKEIKLPSGEYLLVEVPEKAKSLFIHNQKICTDYTFEGIFIKKLPPGQWSIIGKADELTEEQWKEVVDTDGWKDDGYIDYGNQWSQTHVLSAAESGKSLLTHHGYELNKTIILRKD